MPVHEFRAVHAVTIHHAPVVLAGSGRSGTTWLLDLLAGANGLQPIFEPLHPERVPEARDVAYRYLRPDDENGTAKELFESALSGGLRKSWTLYRTQRERLWPGVVALASYGGVRRWVRDWERFGREFRRSREASGKPPIVKIIRGNLMLGWLRSTFSARVALMVRHPCAVVESRLRLGGSHWDPYAPLKRYLADDALVDAELDAIGVPTVEHLTPAEALAWVWCIENALPMRLAEQDGHHVTYYEELASNVDLAWVRLLDALGLDQRPDISAMNRPSQQASQMWRAGRGRFDHWRDRLKGSTLREIESVLERFDVEAYDVTRSMPLTQPVETRRGAI